MPDHLVAEILDGELHTSPRLGVPHALVTTGYAREGVAHVWLLNPIAETLEAYRLEHGRWLLLGTDVGDVSARIEPFEAVALELWRLWGRSEPR